MYLLQTLFGRREPTASEKERGYAELPAESVESQHTCRPLAPGTQIILETKDGVQHYVERADVRYLKAIDNMLRDLNLENVRSPTLPVPISLSAEVLQVIIVHCRRDAIEKKREVRVDKTLEIEKFFPKFSKEKLMELVEAANYLDVPEVFSLGIQKIAHDLRGMTTEQMRQYFGVTGDLTQEEMDQVTSQMEPFVYQAPEVIKTARSATVMSSADRLGQMD